MLRSTRMLLAGCVLVGAVVVKGGRFLRFLQSGFGSSTSARSSASAAFSWSRLMEVSASWNRITAIRRRASCLPLSISLFLARCRKRVASSASPTSAAKAARWRHTPICPSRAAALRWRRGPYPMLLKKEIASRRAPAIREAEAWRSRTGGLFITVAAPFGRRSLMFPSITTPRHP
ncbi:MAG: hypothetical protein RLZZ247_1355 [Cyanobacteriota bacterium]